MWDGKERRKYDPRRALDKDIVKEALKEWLDEKFSTFGKWSMTGLGAMAVAGITYLWLTSNGWHK